jgi:hypothetical protein
LYALLLAFGLIALSGQIFPKDIIKHPYVLVSFFTGFVLSIPLAMHLQTVP